MVLITEGRVCENDRFDDSFCGSFYLVVRIENLQWDNFNKGKTLQVSVEACDQHYGYYPKASRNAEAPPATPPTISIFLLLRNSKRFYIINNVIIPIQYSEVPFFSYDFFQLMMPPCLLRIPL